MPSHHESKILPYSADLMYAVVSDVERYPEFLPWVTGLRIINRVSDREFDSEMRVGFAGINESYVSRVTLDPDERKIDVVLVRGPFRYLENHWHFVPRGGICHVDFSIGFEFKSAVLNMVAGKAFERVLVKLSDAFEGRARNLTLRTA